MISNSIILQSLQLDNSLSLVALRPQGAAMQHAAQRGGSIWGFDM